MEYIERDKAIKAVSGWYRKALHPKNMSSYNEGERAAYRTALSEIAEIPAADVRPVMRGRWERTSKSLMVCSACGNCVVDDRISGMFFCPNCGADMRTGAE